MIETNKPLIIAHRGASSLEPENTMRAFHKACELGADGIELDIFLTKDNQLVVTHDRDTQRLTGISFDVCQSHYHKLSTLDYGKGEQLPLLSDVLEEFKNKFHVINIEIKSTGLFTNGVETVLAQLLNKYSVFDRIIVSSFNPLHLLRLKKILPQTRVACLISQHQHPLARHPFVIKLLRPTTLNLDHRLEHDKHFTHFFSGPIKKWVWTVNEPADLDHWLTQDVDAIITNDPKLLLSLLE
ncbi:MAG: hypothetical protein ACD_62C00622G0005 [uncultured bacterium]|nr:MAG: hypothetical protein ACD_62C00622G0005 [uncultured bacterium]HLD45628.1 glycerophosphodiester phosphodiesterase family protein [bacterium]